MEELNYLESLKPSYISLGLERIKEFFNILPFKIPEKNVIVAGTNGKGSTCAFLSSILSKANLKVGFFSSPHLLEVNERIKINNKNIDNLSLKKYISMVKNLMEKNNKNLTYFEFLTVLALWYFFEEETDINIFEVGLGGRLDATNAIPAIMSIITPISHDHTKILGKSLEKITYEKAGIIKKNVPLILAPQKRKVLNLIKEIAKINSSELIYLNDTLKSKILKIDLEGTYYNLKYFKREFDIFCPLLGEHQVINSSTSILAAIKLSEILNFPLTEETIEIGISSTEWPGRLKKYNFNGYKIFLDGAHNIGGFRALKKTMEKLNLKNLNIGFSALKDKKPSLLLKKIKPFAKKIYLFSLENERGLKEKDWEKIAKKISLKNYEIVPCKEFERKIKESRIDFFTGSLLFLGEVLKCLKK